MRPLLHMVISVLGDFVRIRAMMHAYLMFGQVYGVKFSGFRSSYGLGVTCNSKPIIELL